MKNQEYDMRVSESLHMMYPNVSEKIRKVIGFMENKSINDSLLRECKYIFINDITTRYFQLKLSGNCRYEALSFVFDNSTDDPFWVSFFAPFDYEIVYFAYTYSTCEKYNKFIKPIVDEFDAIWGSNCGFNAVLCPCINHILKYMDISEIKNDECFCGRFGCLSLNNTCEFIDKSISNEIIPYEGKIIMAKSINI